MNQLFSRKTIFCLLGLLFVIYWLVDLSFLVFHTISELVTILAGFTLAIIVWNAFHITSNAFFLFLGMSYAFSSGFDFIHMLTYKGLIVLPSHYEADLPTQAWIIARFLNMVSLLLAFFYLKKAANPWCVFAGYAGFSILMLLCVLIWNIFPECYIEGSGLTPFKIWSEYVIILGNLAALLWLRRKKDQFHDRVFVYLQAFLISSAAMEVCFTLYASVYGVQNIVGHLFKLIAYYFLYKAVIDTSLTKPYELLFYNLNAANQELLAQTEELSQLTKRLEAEVDVNRRLAEGMQQAKIAAEQANSAKGEFLALISHEIRTPLNGILGMTGLVLETPLTVQQRDYLLAIHESGRLLLTIINDVLDYSKIEAGQLNLEQIDFALPQLLRETVSLFASDAVEKQLGLTCELDPDLPLVLKGDPIRIRQILLNLLSNALKFTEQGEIKVSAKCLEQTADKVSLQITVQDTGVGISDEVRHKLFLPFQQADVSTTRRFGGTGLGLSICRQLIDLMSGKLELKSQVGVGSRFSFTLPLAKSAATTILTSAPAACSLPPGEAFRLPLKAAKPVLLVEDNVINCKVVASWLERFGLNVRVAQDGLAAVEAVKRGNYQLILMDCQMPQMDGYEAARQIRSLEQNGLHTPIIAMTASAMTGDREKCLAAGMNDYLAKPFEPQQLYQLLEKWLQQVDDGIDQKKINELLPPPGMEQGEWLKEVIELYLESSKPQFEKLVAAVKQADLETAWKTAHQLKSGAATLGALQLQGFYKKCEEAGKAGKLAVLRDLLPSLELEYERTCQVFQVMKQGIHFTKANDNS